MLICYNILGFPPPDDLLRDWLSRGIDDRPTMFQKLHQFIYSILTVTKERLRRLEGGLLGEPTRNLCRNNAHGYRRR
jgi:hypothetical protein